MIGRLTDRLPPVLLALALGVGAVPASGQTLTGRVLEDGGDTPVAGAAVALLDRDGRRRAEVLSDALGVFHLRPPKAGEYYLVAERVGYRTTRSPLLALAASGSAVLDLVMSPEPIALEGLEVEVEREAEEFLQTFGLTPARLGSRWIGRERIEAMAMPGGVADVITWQGIPGVRVLGGGPVDRVLCVLTTFRSSRETCALIVLNGMVLDAETANDFLLDAHAIEAMAVLGPTEAATFYGTQAGGGAVLIWTRAGGSGR